MGKVSFKRILKLMGLIIFPVAILSSLLACLSEVNEICEIFCHFKFHYLLLSLCLLVLTLFCRSRMTLCIAIAWFTFNAIPVAPYYFPVEKPVSRPGKTIKLLQLNLLYQNKHYSNVLQLIQHEKPDIIGLEEVQTHWVKGLTALERDYPFRLIQPMDSAFGIALYSKLPLKQPHLEYFGAKTRIQSFPSIVADVALDYQPVTLVVTHPVPPMCEGLRNIQLQGMGLARRHFQKNLIIMGDLNVSPWSPFFQDLLEKTGLRDSQLGFGVQPSWPANYWFLQVPIDHILISQDLVVLNRYTGKPIGSDHLPIVAKIALR